MLEARQCALGYRCHAQLGANIYHAHFRGKYYITADDFLCG